MPDPEPPATPPPEATLLDLLMSAQSAEMARENSRREADRVSAGNALSGMMYRIQAAGFNAGDQWSGCPAALSIRAFTNREYGQDFTPKAVRRVRGRVCEVLDIDTAAADALPLSRVADALHEPEHPPAGSTADPLAEYRWLKVTQVAKLFDLHAGEVSKRCDAGTYLSNGKTGTDRRVDVLSVVRATLDQLARVPKG